MQGAILQLVEVDEMTLKAIGEDKLAEGTWAVAVEKYKKDYTAGNAPDGLIMVFTRPGTRAKCPDPQVPLGPMPQGGLCSDFLDWVNKLTKLVNPLMVVFCADARVEVRDLVSDAETARMNALIFSLTSEKVSRTTVLPYKKRFRKISFGEDTLVGEGGQAIAYASTTIRPWWNEEWKN